GDGLRGERPVRLLEEGLALLLAGFLRGLRLLLRGGLAGRLLLGRRLLLRRGFGLRRGLGGLGRLRGLFGLGGLGPLPRRGGRVVLLVVLLVMLLGRPAQLLPDLELELALEQRRREDARVEDVDVEEGVAEPRLHAVLRPLPEFLHLLAA